MARKKRVHLAPKKGRGGGKRIARGRPTTRKERVLSSVGTSFQEKRVGPPGLGAQGEKKQKKGQLPSSGERKKGKGGKKGDGVFPPKQADQERAKPPQALRTGRWEKGRKRKKGAMRHSGTGKKGKPTLFATVLTGWMN